MPIHSPSTDVTTPPETFIGSPGPQHVPNGHVARIATVARRAGAQLARLGLVVVIAWIGALKFLRYEAEAIQPLLANSPLLSWMYSVWSVQGASNVIGAIELTAAALILLRPWSARAAATGSLIAVGMFVTTLSFLFTTPGMFHPEIGFPALAGGGFIVKDLVFLGVAVWSVGEATEQMARTPSGRRS